jgi:dTDP-4-amino-4,6-dideoxygalactose transaminase
MKEDIDNSVHDVIDSCQFIQGNVEKLFESEFAEFIGTEYCVGVANGTDALEIGINALEFSEGSEIITQPNTYIATSLGITYNKLVPIFVDIDPITMMIDHTKIEEKITPKTKALCIVHLYGTSPNMDAIMEIVKKYNLILIEDCAQSHGARYNGIRVGTFGDISCFSFYPGKNLVCFGDGGAICTNNQDLFKKMKLLHNLGSDKKYYHEIMGRNSRLDTIQAAILRIKLKHLDENNNKRRIIANRYSELLKDIDELVIPYINTKCLPVWHLYVIRILNNKRDEFQQFLKSHGIDTIIHYPIPIHKQEAFKMYNNESYPICEKYTSEIISLPMYPELQDNDIEYVCSVIKQWTEIYYNQ